MSQVIGYLAKWLTVWVAVQVARWTGSRVGGEVARVGGRGVLDWLASEARIKGAAPGHIQPAGAAPMSPTPGTTHTITPNTVAKHPANMVITYMQDTVIFDWQGERQVRRPHGGGDGGDFSSQVSRHWSIEAAHVPDLADATATLTK